MIRSDQVPTEIELITDGCMHSHESLRLPR